ncbi:MAG: hypothetical protein WC710_14010 [Gallionella sp.]
MATKFGMYENVIPLLAPFDRAATLLETPYIDLQSANRASFLLYFGVVTSTTATDTLTLTMEASTASTSNASEEAIPFNYRVSVAFATGNTWGAVTAATSAGVSLGASTVFDGFAVLVDVDPAYITEKKPDARYVRLVGTHTDAYSVMLVTCMGFVDPRYKATTMIKATVT